jgi:ATP-dependent DNA helicase RecG
VPAASAHEVAFIRGPPAARHAGGPWLTAMTSEGARTRVGSLAWLCRASRRPPESEISCPLVSDAIAAQVRALLSDLESDRVERTISTKNHDKFRLAICAFANDFPGSGRPGFLLVGANDDGTPSGLTVTDQLLLELAGLRSEGRIQPIPAMTVERVVLPEGELAVVKVLPSDMPPVRFDGRVHIRVGPRRAIASEQEERVLTERRVSSARTFDLQPCRGATLEDLAIELFVVGYRPQAVSADVIEENGRPIEQQLAALRFFDLRTQSPTHAGILLFGKDPRAWLPGAYVQFLRVEGTSIADDIVTEQEISGDLVAVLRRLDDVTSAHLQRRPVAIPGSMLAERNAQTYPPTALRELLLNAVMHRSYDSNAPVRFYWFTDRIEIDNPGGLYGAARPENFPSRNDYRNPVLAEAMKVLGFVNRFGRGVVRAQEELRKNGNPPPEFAFDDPGTVRVILRTAAS